MYNRVCLNDFEMTVAWTGSFHIEGWLVQPQLNRISRGEETAQIEPKIMQVLLYLAAQPGEVVTREAMLDRVWAESIVGEEVLSRAIFELRKVFGDKARAPRVIETIPKMGYRLIAPVSFEETRGDRLPEPAFVVNPSLTLEASKALSPRGSLLRRVALGVAGLVLLMVAAALLFQASSIDAQGEPGGVRTRPLTSFPGQELDPALSPDGERLAFIWSGGARGNLNVYAKVVGTETPLQLTDTPFYEFSPAWSPDGRQIAFARSIMGLFVVPAMGGPERKLAAIGSSSRPQVAWSPTGEWIAYTDRDEANAPYSLHLLAPGTLETQRLTTPPAAYYGDTHPVFSPDGSTLAFIRNSGGAGDVYMVPVTGGAPQRLTEDNLDVAGLTWMPDGRSLIFSSNRGGAYGLWRLSLAGGEPEALSLGAGDLTDPTMALRGDRLAYAQSFVDENIWRIQGEAAAPFIESTRKDVHPHFSPDGQQVAFVSLRSGSPEVWMVDRDGSNPVQLTSIGGAYVATPRWSPDGTKLAFVSHEDGLADVYLLPVEGGRPRRLTDEASIEGAPSWSQDQRWIYFSSNRSGTWQVWKQPVDGGGAVQVTQQGGHVAFEAPDGSLYFTKRRTPGLWRLLQGGGEEVQVLEDLRPVHAGNWCLVDEGIYFVNARNRPATIDFYSFATGKTVSVATPQKEPSWNQYGLTASSDGTVLYTQTDQSHYDIMVTDHIR